MTVIALSAAPDMYVFMYVCYVCIYVCYVCMHMHVCIYVCYVCMHMHVCIYVCYVCMHMHVCMYVSMAMCVYVKILCLILGLRLKFLLLALLFRKGCSSNFINRRHTVYSYVLS